MLLLNIFFSIVDTCLICEDIARQVYVMVPIATNFYILYFQWAAYSTFQTCILNSH